MQQQEFRETIRAEPALMAVEGNTSGSTPRELFDDVIEELEEAYERDAKVGMVSVD